MASHIIFSRGARAQNRVARVARHLTSAAPPLPFSKVLVANRGEIALRIVRAVHELGIGSAAVFTPADAGSLHCTEAMEAVPLDTPNGYLDVNDVLRCASAVGADAVHPGYGFLSEDVTFARAVQDAGMTWIGPPPAALTLFGDKVAARAHACAHGVPVAAGSTVPVGDAAAALDAASKAGCRYPLLLKAAHGGGGRGIRLVPSASEMEGAFASASREAAAAFGNGDLFVEECLQPCHHVEVQVLSDHSGAVIHLFERECSLQQRNQKVIEIAPAPGLCPALRDRLTSDATRLWAAGGGLGAGTVEFLVQGGGLGRADARYCFLEVNPRLQVEHTVTEQVTGVDIVQAQLLLAAGRGLNDIGLAAQASVALRGVALQARLSMTAGGNSVVTDWRPPSGAGVRVESAVCSGICPSSLYDPLLAKIVCTAGAQFLTLGAAAANSADAYDGDQKSAAKDALRGTLARARQALESLHVAGVKTNAALLRAILDMPQLLGEGAPEAAISGGWAHTRTLEEYMPTLTAEAQAIESRWQALHHHDTTFSGGDGGSSRDASGNSRPALRTLLDGSHVGARSPVDGAVVEVRAGPGDEVAAGAPLLLLSAMKMEHVVYAPSAGVVAEVNVGVGDLVAADEIVVSLAPPVEGAREHKGSVSGEDEDSAWDHIRSEIVRRRELALAQGGEAAVAKHHAKGRNTIRERIALLVDGGSDGFDEIGRIAGAAEEDGGFAPANFVLGTGKVEGRTVVCAGEDFTQSGGSPSAAGLRKSVYAETLALELEVPLVRMHEGAGGSVGGAKNGKAKGGSSAAVFDRPRFESVARCLATVPVASAAMGTVAGLPASRLVASHFTVMVRDAQVLTAGPKVVERALGYAISKEELGGFAAVHESSGVVDNVAETEADALRQITRFLSYLPRSVRQLPPRTPAPWQPAEPSAAEATELAAIVPDNRRRGYDVRRLLALIMDEGSLFEIGNTGFGCSQVTGFARLRGRVVGVMANDCMVFAGAMDATGAQKVTKFIELCATFRVPIVSFVDEPGFMIGVEAERAATIRHGTRAVLTAQSCGLPWATVLVRKAYGVAAAAHFGQQAYVVSWPSAETGALPVESGVAVAFARQLREAEDPEAMRAALEAKFSKALTPFAAAEALGVHDLILPEETRPALCAWLERREHLAQESLDRSGGGGAAFTFRA